MVVVEGEFDEGACEGGGATEADARVLEVAGEGEEVAAVKQAMRAEKGAVGRGAVGDDLAEEAVEVGLGQGACDAGRGQSGGETEDVAQGVAVARVEVAARGDDGARGVGQQQDGLETREDGADALGA